MVTSEIKQMEFQEKTVIKLLDLTTMPDTNKTILVKAPTGSGKTVILIKYIDEYISKIGKNTAFIWLCPGKGDLEEQSREKMTRFAPYLHSQNLNDALLHGFAPQSTTFINWELVNSKKNISIREGERKNLFDRIADAHRSGTDFIIIVDEEHANNNSNSKAIIDAFSATHIIRVSATVTKNKKYEFVEINELDVIGEGIITKAVFINEGMEDNVEITDDYDYLLNLADNKRKEISNRYKALNRNIRPLVLIQFPNGQPETISAVENKLESMGYTYDNGMVSKWMSEDKRDLPDNLTANDGVPIFLLMKQAISTGWDCPRAKILVKLREGMSESFTIQTIGRIRRMPEARHYDDDILDYCYVYTFDEEYKAGLISNLDRAYETHLLFLKDKCKTFTLEKQTRDLDHDGLGEREVMQKIYNALVKKYNLSNDKSDNILRFKGAGYIFGEDIIGHVLYGEYVRTDKISEGTNFYTTKTHVDTHKYGLQLLHCVDSIKTAIGMQTSKVKTILERLFRKGIRSSDKLLSLDTAEFYAFVINNVRLLKQEFREVTADMDIQLAMNISPKTSVFRLPEQDFFKYDPCIKDEIEYLNNAYNKYTSGYITDRIRSRSEQLFEEYCEKCDDIEWVYKNGDSGQQYFSIVYVNGIGKQMLFYADYIILKKNGEIWIIETKGGEYKGQDKNIDTQIENKFNAFKSYAVKHGLNWGFVRDMNGQLYICNTEFSHDMSKECWQPIKGVF